MKHAYCILAHNNFNQLQNLIDIIDDRRNTIFLHIDKKVKHEYILRGGCVSKFSKIYDVDSIDVRWGDYSLMSAEVECFKKVVKSNIVFDRIHLLSGLDLPLKSQDYIHDYFLSFPNVEFIDFGSNIEIFKRRLDYYHFFVKYIKTYKIANLMRHMLLFIQKPFVHRLKNSPYTFKYGSEWCSLSLKAVRKIVSDYFVYKNCFKYSLAPDECYKQMILFSDKSFEFFSKGNMRYIDWKGQKDSPRTLTMEDLDSLMDSDCLFARKFNEKIDNDIISVITNYISNNTIVIKNVLKQM